MTVDAPTDTAITEALTPNTGPAITEAADTETSLRIWDKAAGDLAKAQGWNCIGCGLTLAGATGMIAFTSGVTLNGKQTGSVPVVLHDACLDDARWTGDLRDVADIHAAGTGSDANAATAARVGAIVHAVASARQLLARLPQLNADANAPPEPKAAAPATAAVTAWVKPVEKLPALRGDGYQAGGAD